MSAHPLSVAPRLDRGRRLGKQCIDEFRSSAEPATRRTREPAPAWVREARSTPETTCWTLTEAPQTAADDDPDVLDDAPPPDNATAENFESEGGADPDGTVAIT